jgi:hypothetical protein
MMRFAAIAASVVAVVLCAVLLAGASGPKDAADATSPCIPADAAALRGPASWHYRNSQPVSWRSCLLRQ